MLQPLWHGGLHPHHDFRQERDSQPFVIPQQVVHKFLGATLHVSSIVDFVQGSNRRSSPFRRRIAFTKITLPSNPRPVVVTTYVFNTVTSTSAPWLLCLSPVAVSMGNNFCGFYWFLFFGCQNVFAVMTLNCGTWMQKVFLRTVGKHLWSEETCRKHLCTPPLFCIITRVFPDHLPAA